jgi:hypothetical protein
MSSTTNKGSRNTLISKALFELQCLNEIMVVVGRSTEERPAAWLDYFAACIERVTEIVDEAGTAK